ncbi:hypothetical protein PHMEG_0003277 [Phytophthora megakarya]|uniref:ZZ-type domain-containing protein n=1 Tax=Phytophthora megakarya TaxID=4795 RepID=A0A225WWP0_9STRA|nr:hypothetical protein PHMEG_0003277 [Phytophthora megakarya]
MLATATLQHNLAALQAQLATLQQENSALTRDVCLKENYIQLKDQQFRVMQRRLEELEGAVAQWKDRWLQQVNAQQASDEAGQVDRLEDAQWTPWKCKPGVSNRAKALVQARTKLEKFSQTDRNKLQPLLAAMEQSGAASMDDLVFADVSEELSRVLLLYLLPALLDSVDGAQQLQCFSRTYRKQTMDFRVCAVDAKTGAEEPAAPTASDKQPPPAPVAASVDSVETLAPVTQPLETEETEAPHLFDCVELDRRGAARNPVPHGPRELHATKAMFVSRPLSGSAAARAAIPSLDKLDKQQDKASRRYTLTPKRSGPTFAVETTRTHTMTMGALPSPGQSPSSMGVLPLGSDGEVIPMPPREKEGKDGKIKKIVGSVFDRLSRHKSQQSLVSNSTTSSSSHASPVPLSGEAVGDDDESICDGCGRGPLVGVKWVCRTCRVLAGEEYELCEKCYGQGIHGKEHEDALFARVEAIVVRKCPRLASETELLHLLRVGICKANLKKFSFCLTWIADLLQCNRTTDLRARALEIAHIPPTVRSEFARLLRELLMRYRPDIDLKTEWEPAAGAQHGVVGPGTPAMRGEGAPDELDTLRIWVKDAPPVSVSSGSTNIGTPSLG